MTRRNLILILAATTALSALALSAARARDVPKVATGFVAGVLCTETFVSGLDPARVFAETTSAMPGAGLIAWLLDYRVDRARKGVTVTLFGFGRSYAVYRGDGLGCYLDLGGAVTAIVLPQSEARPALLPDIAGRAIVEPQTPQLAVALDRAFAEPDRSTPRNTRAVVILKDGRIIAERYAEGIGVDTPLLGFSATKSVVSALAGILVRKGALRLHEPVPIAAWHQPGDPRRAITLDHLLRHTAGLKLGSSLQASLASALEPVNRMKFMEPDMAAYAVSMPAESVPGAAWNYHDGNTVILAHLIRQATGGSAAHMIAFARQELFEPLGMRNVTLEFDASGNAEGSSQLLASARDWARFGRLYLNDGMTGGKRILPEGWAKYAATPTPNAWIGQGAGFWTNHGDSFGATYRTERGWPRDAIFAKGTLGQYVIGVPSERLVIVRFGRSPNWPPEADGVFELVRDVVGATDSKGKLAGAN
ncbi:serine hydrolase [Bradyrhizobium sp. sBnM-33]|uniref:serine hydrolase domain-containing protein n=1 Tax=Bradyrhizobium sp. sBnM-33 TaxID=2831780 RepID=UPI001BD13962|nr:serine hydrolase [Bradyrhizobium sp. sBnM-33]WOH50750.1 serine hydrolase [Bradyrhizobium sp. sBnM-33]